LGPYVLRSPEIGVTTTFYIASVDEGTGCERRVAVTASVGSFPPRPVIAPLRVCGSGVGVLRVQLPGGGLGSVVNVYAGDGSGSLIGSDGSAPYEVNVGWLESSKRFIVESVDIASGCSVRVSAEAVVESVPEPPLVMGLRRCGPGPVTLSFILGGLGGSEVLFFDSPLPGAVPVYRSDNAPHRIFLPSVSATSVYYAAVRSFSGCVGGLQEVIVGIDPIPSVPLVPSVRRCGSGSVEFSASLGSVTGDRVRMYESLLASSFIAEVSISPYRFESGVLSGSRSFFFSVLDSQTGCESARVAASALIEPVPSVPLVSDVRRCGGGRVSFTAILQDNLGGEVRLYTSSSGLSASSVSVQSPHVVSPPGDIFSDVLYFISVRSVSSGCESARVGVWARIEPLPAAPVASSLSLCGGGRGFLTVSQAGFLGEEVRLYGSGSGGAILARSENLPHVLTTPEVTVTSIFYLESYNRLSGCVSSRSQVSVQVEEVPAVPQAASAHICGGGVVTFTVQNVGAGQEVALYSLPSGGDFISKATVAPYQLVSDFILESGFRYISVRNPVTGCQSPRLRVEVNVYPLPGLPQVGGVSRCGPGAVTITGFMGQPSGTLLRLWDSPVGGFLVGQSFSPPYTITTPELESDGVYYLESYSEQTGCVSKRVMVEAKVHPLPGIPDASAVRRCGAGVLTFTGLMGQPMGDVLNLYVASVGGVRVSSSSSQPYILTTPSISASADFYLSSVNTLTGCESARRLVRAEVLEVPGLPVGKGAERCGSGSLTVEALMGNPSGDELLLYSLPFGGVALGSDNLPPYRLQTPELTTSATYYLESVSSVTGCRSGRSAVVLSVYPQPGLPQGRSITRCGAGAVTFTGVMGSPSGDVMLLYDSSDGGGLVSSDIGSPYELPSGLVSQTTTFYLESWDRGSGCRSLRQPVVVIVNPGLGLPQASDVELCGGGSATIMGSMGNPPGELLRLYDAAVGGSLLGQAFTSSYTFTTPFVSRTTTYYLESASASTGCVSARLPVTVKVLPLPSAPLSSEVSRCGPGSVVLSAVLGSSGDVLQVYNSEGGVVGISSEAPHRVTLNGVSSSQTYWLEAVGSNNCRSQRVGVGVHILPLPGRPIVLPARRCGRGEVVWSVGMGSPVGSEIRLYDDPAVGGGSELARASRSPYLLRLAEQSQTATYYAESYDSRTGCSSARVEAEVRILPVPTQPEVSDVTRCGLGRVRFTAQMGLVGGSEVRLYDVASGGGVLAVASSAPFELESPLVRRRQRYYVSVYDASTGCESDRVGVEAIPELLPGVPFASPIRVCSTGVVTFSGVMGIPGGSVLKLYTSAEGGIPIVSSQSEPWLLPVSSLGVGVHTFYLESENETGGCRSERVAVWAEVLSRPGVGQAAEVSRCGGGLVTFTASFGFPLGDEFRLYDAAVGGNLLVVRSQFPFTLTPPAIETHALYYLEAVDRRTGCRSERVPLRAWVFESLPPPLAGNSGPVCAGEVLRLTATSGVGSSVSYRWRGPGGFEAEGAEISFVALSAGASGVYSVVASSGLCSSSFGTTRVEVKALPAPPAVGFHSVRGYGRPLCAGDDLQLEVRNIGDYSAVAEYEWIGPNFYLSGSHPYPSIRGALQINEGLYYVRVRDGGCSSALSEGLAVKIKALPARPTASYNGPLCVGSRLELMASEVGGAASYVWSGPLGFSATGRFVERENIGVSGGGFYSVRAISAEGCVSEAGGVEVEVVSPPLVASPWYRSPLCAGGELELRVGEVLGGFYRVRGPDGYEVSGTESVYRRGGVTLAMGGEYEVLTVAKGCSVTQRLNVVVRSLPPAPELLSNSPVCVGGGLRLTASGSGLGSYYIEGVNNYYQLGRGGLIENVGLEASGLYRAYVVDAAGCRSEESVVNVSIHPVPRVFDILQSGPYCSGSAVTLTALGSESNLYHWRGPGGFSGEGQSVSFEALGDWQSGLYTVWASNGVCSTSLSRRVEVLGAVPRPILRGNSPVCVGGLILLSGYSVLGSEIHWQGPLGFHRVGSEASRQASSGLEAGVYSAVAVIGQCSSEVSTIEVGVSLGQEPVVTSNSPVCQGGVLRFTLSDMGASYYEVVGPDGWRWAGSSRFVERAGVELAGGGTYSVVSVSSAGCSSAAALVSVIVERSPAPPVIGVSGGRCVGDILELRASGGGAGALYSWELPGGGWASGSQLSVPVVSAGQSVYGVRSIVGACSSAFAWQSVVTESAPIAPVLVHNGPVCVGGELVLTASGSGSNVLYRWYGPNGQRGEGPVFRAVAQSELDGGLYRVVAHMGSCSSESVTSVGVEALPIGLRAYSSETVCAGGVGRLWADALGGARYFWEGPGNFRSANREVQLGSMQLGQSGTYYVTVRKGACQVQLSVVLQVLPTPLVPVARSNSPLCAGQDLSLQASGGAAGARYIWRGPGGFSETGGAIILPGVGVERSGDYSVFAVLGQCSSGASRVRVEVLPVPEPPQAIGPSFVCLGGDLQLQALGSSATSYEWLGPEGYSSTERNPVRRFAEPGFSGRYTVFALERGCRSAGSEVWVRVVGGWDAVAGNNGPVCAGQSLGLTASFILGARYEWRGPGGFVSVEQNPVIDSVATWQSGVYSVQVFLEGCSSMGVTRVEVLPSLPPLAISSNSPLCAGEDLELRAPDLSGVTYSWRGPGGWQSAVASPKVYGVGEGASGVYSLVVARGSCRSEYRLEVLVRPRPVRPLVREVAPVCAGSRVALGAVSSAGSSYYWRGPGGYESFESSPSLVVERGGLYEVVAYMEGCSSERVGVRVDVLPSPSSFTVESNSPVCAGSVLELSAVGGAGWEYIWYLPGGGGFVGSRYRVLRAGALQSGVYSVVARIGACSSGVVTHRAEVAAGPVIESVGNNGPLCAGDNLELRVSGSLGARYLWRGPGGYVGEGFSVLRGNVGVGDGGSYSVVGVVGSCSSAEAVTRVVVHPRPSAPRVTSNSPVCAGGELLLRAEASGALAYEWVGVNNFRSSFPEARISPADVSASGVYTVWASNGFCRSAGSVLEARVIAKPEVGVILGNSPLCSGGRLQLTAPYQAGAEYIWQGPGGFEARGSTLVRENISFSEGGVYSVRAVVGGCSSSAVSYEVLVRATPPTPVAGNNGPLCAGERLELTSVGFGGFYRWSGPGGFISEGSQAFRDGVSVGQGGRYEVVAVLEGCSSGVGYTDVVVHPRPGALTAAYNGPVCAGSRLELVASETEGSYEWSGPDGYRAYSRIAEIGSAQLWHSGVYSVVARLGSCTSSMATVAVQVNPRPEVLRGGSNGPVCAGGILSLSAESQAGAFYDWRGPGGYQATGSNPVIAGVSSSASGVYSVSARIGNCVSPVQTVEVRVLPSPGLIEAGYTGAACSGGSLSLTASLVPGAFYDWRGPGFSSSLPSPVIEGLSGGHSGVYSVVARLGVCSSNVATVRVEVVETPKLSGVGSNSPVCAGGELSLWASVIEGAEYEWSGPGGWRGFGVWPVLSGVTASAEGDYSVVAVRGGCRSTEARTSVRVEACGSCPKPEITEVVALDGGGAIVRWFSGLGVETPVCYIIRYGLASEPSSGWLQQLVPAAGGSRRGEIRLGGLIEGEVYQVEARSNCSECSLTRGSLSAASERASWYQGGNNRLAGRGGEVRFSVYPNPSRGILRISGLGGELYRYRVLNTAGSCVGRGSLSASEGEALLDISELAEGVYVLEIEGAAGGWRHKVLHLR
jgi:hypothetical protein